MWNENLNINTNIIDSVKHSMKYQMQLWNFFLLILGNIRNTQKVYYKDRHNFILKIIAQDCGGKPSKAVFVNILVKEKCRPQWTSKGKKQDR